MSQADKNGMRKEEWGAFFEQKGWKIFAAEIAEDIERIYVLLRTVEGNELYRAQGIASVLVDIRNWPDQQLNRSEDEY